MEKKIEANIKDQVMPNGDIWTIVEGVIADNTAIGDKSTLNIFGTAQGVDAFAGSYVGVGANGLATWVNVYDKAVFEIWTDADATDATVFAGGVARVRGGLADRTSVFGAQNNAANFYVDFGGEADRTFVGAYGNFHVNGIAESTFLTHADAFMGVGAKGIAYDTTILAGAMNVYAGGFADDVTVRGGTLTVNNLAIAEGVAAAGGVATVLAGGVIDNADINSQIQVAGDAAIVGEIEVNNNGDLTLFNGSYVDGEVWIDGGSVNTFGYVNTKSIFTVEFDNGANATNKAAIDNYMNLGEATIMVEFDSAIREEGRYLIAGNAAATYGTTIYLNDDNKSYGAVIGGVGFFKNNKTYAFNIDANNNLYMDVYDAQVDYADYTAANTLGTGFFGVVGNQKVWTDGAAVAIAGIGAFTAPGTFVGIGDFYGDNVDDILFANGNDLIALNLTNADADANGIFDSAFVTYKDALALGTMDDFQIASTTLIPADSVYAALNANGADEIFIKRAEGYYDVASLLSVNADGTGNAIIVNSSTRVG